MTNATDKTENVAPSFTADAPAPTRSERVVLCAVLRKPAITQPEISRATHLPQQSVSRLVKGLIEGGFIEPNARKPAGRRGQPSMAVGLRAQYAYTFGVSMMTDAMSIALMDFAGNIESQRYFPMPVMTRPAVIETLNGAIESILGKRNIGRDKVMGIGVGISGYSLDGRSRYNTPRKLDDWALVDINDILSDATGFPVLVENDGNAAALGESLYGHGRSFSNFVYLYVAAGIGGGVIINHDLMRGSNGNGGEVGLMLPGAHYPRPTLERLREAVSANGINIANIAELIASYQDDWPGVDSWLDDMQAPFSIICSSVAALLDVEAIIFGGRLPQALTKRILPRIEIYDDARRAEPRPRPRLLASSVEGDACAIGAAALPFKARFFNTD